MKKLLVITTGGTIDKLYFDANSRYGIGEPAVNTILKSSNTDIHYEIREACRKDSLELEDADRAKIAEAVNNANTDKILITHGTDTMVATAQYLEQLNICDANTTIVLTGAMQPAAFKISDSEFNIGMAIGVLNCATPGIYIAMNGRIFSPHEAQKNYSAQKFEYK